MLETGANRRETATAAAAAAAVVGPSGADLNQVLRDYLDVASRLEHTHETLQREVVRLREELASKDRELERGRRLAALGELAAGVAHEVRNPLGAIQLYSDLLRSECGARALEPALRLIEKIEAGIRAIDGVVQDTLALAPRDRDLRPIALRPVVERAHDVARGSLQARGVTLQERYGDADARVIADEHGLQRVLVNLFVNAADASPPDERISVDCTSGEDGGQVVRVADRGCGLPDELLDRIFDPFFTTKEHGTGLGLTIAHRLIEAYGGRLTAGNRPGGGAEFVLYLRGDVAAPHRRRRPEARRTTAA
jgi:signal transduction histidine kinase